MLVLLLVFWYCHKRGKEVRLAKERLEAGEVDDSGRFEEIDDSDYSDGAATPRGSRREIAGPSNYKGRH